MDLKNKIMGNLEKVIDPETKTDVVGMGLIRDLDVTCEGKVSFSFRPSSSVCPLVFSLALKIKEAIEGTEGVNGVNMIVTDHTMADELNELLKN